MKNKILLNTFVFTILTYTSIVYANFLTINYDAWIGHNINELTNSWGYADESFKAPNGNDVYVYTTAKESDTLYKTIGILKIKSRDNKFCKKFFEASNNIIVSWNMKGNNCQSLIGDRRTHPTIPPKIKSQNYVKQQIKSQKYQFANVLEIKQVCTSVIFNGSDSMQLKIDAKGNVNSMGWTNATLLPWVYSNGKPNNGILDFTFIANKPKSSNLNTQVIIPIKIEYIIKNENWIKGLVIHTSTNSLQAAKGKCSYLENPPINQ